MHLHVGETGLSEPAAMLAFRVSLSRIVDADKREIDPDCRGGSKPVILEHVTCDDHFSRRITQLSRFTRQKRARSASVTRAGTKARLCSTGNSSCGDRRGGRGAHRVQKSALPIAEIRRPVSRLTPVTRSSGPNPNRGVFRQVKQSADPANYDRPHGTV